MYKRQILPLHSDVVTTEINETFKAPVSMKCHCGVGGGGRAEICTVVRVTIELLTMLLKPGIIHYYMCDFGHFLWLM